MKLRATLTLDLVYEGPDATDKYIESLLGFMVEHAANNGMFSGDGDLTVEEWTHKIEIHEVD